jgi:hypothetical protein
MIWPFLTAATREKVQLVSGQAGLDAIHSMVPASILPLSLGGTSPQRPFAESVRQLARLEGDQHADKGRESKLGFNQYAAHARHSSMADSLYSDATDVQA